MSKAEESKKATEPAVEAGEEQVAEDVMHTLPPALLDVMAATLGVRYTRMVIVARLMTPHAKDKVGKHHEELIEKAKVDVDGNVRECNGVALVQSHSLVNFIEADPEVCSAYLGLLQAESVEEELPWAIEDVRIVGQCEDCPSSTFPKWRYSVLALPKEPDVDLESENVTTAASILFNSFCKVGAALIADKGDEEAQFAMLAEKHTDKLPSNERALAFSERDEVFSLEDHVEFFGNPIRITLGSEKVWPITRRMPY